MQYNANKRIFRNKVPVQVVRGFEPTTPGKLSSLAAPIDDEAIESGMVLVKDTGLVAGVSTDGAFRKAVALDAPSATSEGTSFYIALHDQDSHDVQASGGLVGLDCSDDYEIQSGHFVAGTTYVLDMPLTVNDGGEIDEAVTAADVIIGYITKVGANANGSIAYTGKTPSSADSDVIQFKTARGGQIKAV